jgi:MoxR-like ATPase
MRREPDSNMAVAEQTELQTKLKLLQENLRRVIQGKDEAIETLVIALIAGGSILMEDVPGVGKTILARALAKSIDASFNRVQFTPDLLPADILGSSIYNPVEGSFTFHPGPVFCNVLLGDEINRASPRTQSALLEAMNEGQVTVDGMTRTISAPFLVIATENPVEFHGTYPLPEAQLDRFLIWLELGYPDPETEVDILYAQVVRHPIQDIRPVMSRVDVLEAQEAVARVTVERSVSRYLVDIVNHTRSDGRLKLGASPRGALMLFRAAQAAALLAGRDYVLPDDLQRVAVPVLAHRLVMTSKAAYGGTNKRQVVAGIVETVPVPV